MFGSADHFTPLSTRSSQVNEAAQENSNDNKAVKKKKPGEVEKSLVSKLLDGDKEAKNELVRESMNAMSQNNKATNNLKQQVKQNLDALFSKKESTEDSVMLSSFVQQEYVNDEIDNQQKKAVKDDERATVDGQEDSESNRTESFIKGKDANAQSKTLDQMKKTNQNRATSDEFAKKSFQEENKSALKEYSTAFADCLISKSPQQKQKMDDIKKQLQENGVSTAALTKMEAKVGNMVRQQMVANLKDSMLKYLFSKTESKNSEMLNKSKLLNTLMGMEQNEALGGKDFGNYGKGLSSVFDDSSQDLKNEISDFMLDETEETFVKNTINNKDSKTLSQELGKLQKFCSDAGVQINNRALMKRINSAIDDIGLAHFIPPENTKQSFSFSEGDQRGKQPQEAPMIYLSKEEQLVDRLRQLYFQKALNPGIKANFELYFKIRTTKNNLIKIGAVDKDTERRLEAEAQLLAKEKLLDDLYKVFIEQATLQKLEGPTYDILRNRKAFLIKSLHKIGYKIREDEINRIRDRANSEIFPIIKEQLHKIEMLADINQSIQATRQRKILIETLTRIKEESKLSESIDTNLNFEDSGFVERTVVEAA